MNPNSPYERRKPSSRAAIDALRRYPGVPIRSLARYLFVRHEGMFESMDHARGILRVEAGVRKSGQPGKFRTIEGIESRRGVLPPVPATLRLHRPPYQLPRGVWGVMADLHVPFHEPKPIETAMQWFRDSKVTGIIFNGDLQDCEAVSYFGATRPRNFLSEVEKVCDFLDMMKKAFPKAQFLWQEGNHEERLESYYRHNAPHLADVPTASIESLLQLDRRGVVMLDRKQRITMPSFTMIHGHEMKGGYSPVSSSRWALLKAKTCVSVAHFHQTNETTHSDINRKMLTAWGFGCLCDLSPDHNTYANGWNWGAAMVYNGGGNDWSIENRRILTNGKLY